MNIEVFELNPLDIHKVYSNILEKKWQIFFPPDLVKYAMFMALGRLTRVTEERGKRNINSAVVEMLSNGMEWPDSEDFVQTEILPFASYLKFGWKWPNDHDSEDYRKEFFAMVEKYRVDIKTGKTSKK